MHLLTHKDMLHTAHNMGRGVGWRRRVRAKINGDSHEYRACVHFKYPRVYRLLCYCNTWVIICRDLEQAAIYVTE